MLPNQIQALKQAQRNIRYAQSLLLKPNLNTQYAAVSYLRLCCSAIIKLRLVGLDLAPELDLKCPYLSLLENLYKHDPLWVQTCTVSAVGCLVSSDLWVDRQLEIIRYSSLQILLETTQRAHAPMHYVH